MAFFKRSAFWRTRTRILPIMLQDFRRNCSAGYIVNSVPRVRVTRKKVEGLPDVPPMARPPSSGIATRHAYATPRIARRQWLASAPPTLYRMIIPTWVEQKKNVASVQTKAMPYAPYGIPRTRRRREVEISVIF